MKHWKMSQKIQSKKKSLTKLILLIKFYTFIHPEQLDYQKQLLLNIQGRKFVISCSSEINISTRLKITVFLICRYFLFLDIYWAVQFPCLQLIWKQVIPYTILFPYTIPLLASCVVGQVFTLGWVLCWKRNFLPKIIGKIV